MENNIEPGEVITPDLWDETLFKEMWEPIYRLASANGRMYYRRQEDEVHWYMSVTNAIKRVLPTSPYLIDWMIKHGNEGGERKKEEAAEYGTMMHIFNADFLIKGEYDFANIEDDIAQYVHEHKPKYADLVSMRYRLVKDMLAFIKWCSDYEVKPMAIEVVVYSDRMKLAGAIDIICEMNDKKYTDKTAADKRNRVAAIVDMKSGGIWDSHGLQLEIYRQMWNELYAHYPITKIANWSPNSWKGAKPTYTYKEWDADNNAMVRCIDEYISIINKQEDIKPRKELVVKGAIKLGEDPDEKIWFESIVKGGSDE